MIDELIIGLGFGLGAGAANELKEIINTKLSIKALNIYTLSELIEYIQICNRVKRTSPVIM